MATSSSGQPLTESALHHIIQNPQLDYASKLRPPPVTIKSVPIKPEEEQREVNQSPKTNEIRDKKEVKEHETPKAENTLHNVSDTTSQGSVTVQRIVVNNEINEDNVLVVWKPGSEEEMHNELLDTIQNNEREKTKEVPELQDQTVMQGLEQDAKKEKLTNKKYLFEVVVSVAK
ncbi:hypothetical protein HAX54_011027, partial [Datura stramonium]|nr:hypothetical protein [Datura stramonium]